MKNKMAKTSAAFAAALMTACLTAPVFAAQPAAETQPVHDFRYFDYDKNGLPVWNRDMCMEEADQYSIEPGKYYIYVTTKGGFCPEGVMRRNVYSLIKIDEVSEEDAPFGFGTIRTAKYRDTQTGESHELGLNAASLYEVSGLSISSAAF
ncbi:MAG: hypothetical protein HUJ54_10500 [Erysipelotrichaceae bacterium]|nr:hypothetical protein [Erysipelotrichaceae bacterium]